MTRNHWKLLKSHTYLGTELCTNGSFGGAIDTVFKKATKAMFKLISVIQQTNIAARVANYISLTLLLGPFTYGCEVWGPCVTNIKMFEETTNYELFDKAPFEKLDPPPGTHLSAIHCSACIRNLATLPQERNLEDIQ